jgi:hypothetical protein
MRKIGAAILLMSITVMAPLTAQDAAHAKRGPSTEEERTKALAMIADLETNPLGPQAKDERRWLTFWLIEVPDIHVSFCTDLLPDRPKDKNDGVFVSTQMMFSSARYAIQHDGGSSDSVEEYQAGVEGALKVYQALLSLHPKDREPGLDDLVQRDYVKDRVAGSCKKK